MNDTVKRYKVGDIPFSARQILLADYHATPEYKNMREECERQSARAVSKLSSVISLRLKEEQHLDSILRALHKKGEDAMEFCESLCFTLSQVREKLTQEEQDAFEAHVNAILLITDKLETESMEINEILHRKFPDYDFEQFSSVIRMAKEAKDVLRGFHNVQNDKVEEMFAEEADRLSEYIDERAKVFMRKLRRGTEHIK